MHVCGAGLFGQTAAEVEALPGELRPLLEYVVGAKIPMLGRACGKRVTRGQLSGGICMNPLHFQALSGVCYRMGVVEIVNLRRWVDSRY